MREKEREGEDKRERGREGDPLPHPNKYVLAHITKKLPQNEQQHHQQQQQQRRNQRQQRTTSSSNSSSDNSNAPRRVQRK